jgi:HPt (histidine-containing phosphotransfer) domain-containing protein
VRDLRSLHEMAARLGSGEAGACGELEHLAHQMCGTAAMLKFDSLSSHASAIERLAEAHAEGTEALGGGEPGGAVQNVTERLTNYLGQLEQELSALILAMK